MGLMIGCCKIKSTANSEVSIEIYEYDEKLLDKVKSILDANQGLSYLTSPEFYSVLTELTISKYMIMRKVVQKLSNDEIFALLKKIFNYINNINIDKFEPKTKKRIEIIKINMNIRTSYIIKELNNIQFETNTECQLVKSLTDFSMILQCVIYLKNLPYGVNEYKTNLWGNKNIYNEMKKYMFDAVYYLFQIKVKYTYKKTINNKITKENRNELNGLYTLVNNFVNEEIISDL